MAHDVTLTINAACQGESGNVDNGGAVYFVCTPQSATINYTPTDAFTGSYNGSLPLTHNNGVRNGPFNIKPKPQDFTINYTVEKCHQLTAQTGGYTIKVGS